MQSQRLGQAFPGPVHECGKKDRELCPGNGGMLEGGAAGWWGPPALPAWWPLLSHALPWLAALGWNKHRDAHRAQDEQHSPLSSADTVTTVPTGTATLHAGLCSQSRNQWATLFPFSNFSLVKWSTCWSCVFNLPDIEATTTSLSALSQHRNQSKQGRSTNYKPGGPGWPGAAAFKLSATILIHFDVSYWHPIRQKQRDFLQHSNVPLCSSQLQFFQWSSFLSLIFKNTWSTIYNVLVGEYISFTFT